MPLHQRREQGQKTRQQIQQPEQVPQHQKTSFRVSIKRKSQPQSLERVIHIGGQEEKSAKRSARFAARGQHSADLCRQITAQLFGPLTTENQTSAPLAENARREENLRNRHQWAQNIDNNFCEWLELEQTTVGASHVFWASVPGLQNVSVIVQLLHQDSK